MREGIGPCSGQVVWDPSSGVCRQLQTFCVLLQGTLGGGLMHPGTGRTAPLPELAPGRRSQHRQHEVITPVGTSCPLNTDWRRAPPPTLSLGSQTHLIPLHFVARQCQALPSGPLQRRGCGGSFRRQSQQSGQVGGHHHTSPLSWAAAPLCPISVSLPHCSAGLMVEPGSLGQLRHVDDKVPEGPPREGHRLLEVKRLCIAIIR